MTNCIDMCQVHVRAFWQRSSTSEYNWFLVVVFGHNWLNWKKSNPRTVLKKIHNEPQSMGRTLWRHHMMSHMIGKYRFHYFTFSFLSCNCKFLFMLNCSCVIYWPNRLFPCFLLPGFHTQTIATGRCGTRSLLWQNFRCLQNYLHSTFLALRIIVLHYVSCVVLHRIWRVLCCVLHCIVWVYKNQRSIKNYL
jgi:hypothetical protein